MTKNLDSEFSEKNLKRCDEVFKQVNPTNLYWATSIAEEAGEICGAIKKLERGFNERELSKFRKKNPESELTDEQVKEQWLLKKKADIGQEVADLLTIIDLFCTKNQIDIGKEITNKFNQVSVEMKSDILLNTFE